MLELTLSATISLFFSHSAPAFLIDLVMSGCLVSIDVVQEGTTVALAIKAAFDRVWHKGLLAKLDANGVGAQLLQ